MNIIFLHGLTGSHHNFDGFKTYFKNAKSFDIIGFASERKPKTTYDKQLFLDFLETKIHEDCIIIGHSMGAILAKDFAILHPELVKRVYLLSYPLQKDQNGIKNILNKDIFVRFYMSNSILSKSFCSSKAVWKYLLLVFIFIFAKDSYNSAKDSFKHTYNSVYSSIIDYIEKDDWKSIQLIKDKLLFISGENDFYVDKDLINNFNHVTIANMSHLFSGYENEISKIINNDMSSNKSGY